MGEARIVTVTKNTNRRTRRELAGRLPGRATMNIFFSPGMIAGQRAGIPTRDGVLCRDPYMYSVHIVYLYVNAMPGKLPAWTHHALEETSTQRVAIS